MEPGESKIQGGEPSIDSGKSASSEELINAPGPERRALNRKLFAKFSGRKHKVIGSVAVALLVLAVFVAFLPNSPLQATGGVTSINTPASEASGSFDNSQGFAVESQGSQNSVQAQLDSAQPVGEKLDSKESKAVLLKEAGKQGIVVNDTSVNELIKANLVVYQLSEPDFVLYLEQNGFTLEQYKAELKDQIAIAQLVNKTLNLQDVKVSDEEVDDFVEQNSDAFGPFLEDENDLADLKTRIRYKLLQDKQTELVLEYVENLRQLKN